jgi:tRNA threonylcarbamoyladenosine biosynthesis protein TsaE
MKLFEQVNEAGLIQVAHAIAPSCRPGDMICLSGALGAGKTSFARGLIHGLGWPETHEVASPTFNLVVQYLTPDVRLPIAHVDLYRLDDARQVIGLGLEDMMDDHLLIIEWPERWGQDLPPEHLRIAIDGTGDVRSIAISGASSWIHRLQQLKVKL